MKTAIITGGTKGIGKALVFSFARLGFTVFTCGRSPQSIAALQTAFAQSFDANLLRATPADLTTAAGRQHFASYVQEHTAQVQVLINNAGTYVPGQVSTEEEGALELMLQSHVHSAYDITRALLPLMPSHAGAHIFNMCSTASITPYINGGSYCIAKHALLGFNKVLREELKERGIKVTAILPGATRTASWDGVDLPDHLFMQAQDIADVIVMAYQLSPSACVEELLIRPLPGDIK